MPGNQVRNQPRYCQKKQWPCPEKCTCPHVWPSENPEFYASLIVRGVQESNPDYPKGLLGLLFFLEVNSINLFGSKKPDFKKFSKVFQEPDLEVWIENYWKSIKIERPACKTA